MRKIFANLLFGLLIIVSCFANDSNANQDQLSNVIQKRLLYEQTGDKH
ncbi:hypothetical protein [Francisella halioticida]|nr:hypothetical protein [Francisella halioticida]